MKNQFLTIANFILVCLLCLFNSCNREDSPISLETDIDNNKIELSEYGKFHNYALDLYYQNSEKSKSKQKNSIPEYIYTTSNLMKKTYPELFGDINTSKIISEYNSFKKYSDNQKINNRKVYSGNYSELLTMLDYLLESKKISNKNYIFIKNNLTIDRDYNTKIKAIDDYIYSEKLSEYDLTQIQIVKSILISSNEYWNKGNNYSNTIYAKGTPKGRAVIIYDAVGALLWSFHPVASIIGAAAYSLLAEEMF